MSKAHAAATEPDLTMMLLIHKALRRDLARLATAFGSAEISRPQALALNQQWQLFARNLHEHHTVEDRLIWPKVEQRAGDEAGAVLAAMAAEHEVLDPMLADTSELVSSFVANPSSPMQSAVASSLARLIDTLEHHLGHEEHDAIPLIERHLTKADLDQVTATQRREGGIAGAQQFLPWVLEEAPPRDRAQVLDELPLPVRALVKRWQRAHERDVIAAFGPH